MKSNRREERVRSVQQANLAQAVRLDVIRQDDTCVRISKSKSSPAIAGTLDCEKPVRLADSDQVIAISQSLFDLCTPLRRRGARYDPVYKRVAEYDVLVYPFPESITEVPA